MRELTADLFVTLDGFGFGEGAPAYFGYLGPDLERWIEDQIAEPQVVLMGRVTYEALLPIVQTQDVEGGVRLNQLPKVVFSSTLREPLEWNNSRVASGDLATEVKALKEQPGDPLRTMGSISVVKSLLEAGLVDRLRLMVFPQILGATGRAPVFRGLPDINLDLVATNLLDGRLVELEYRPVASQAN